MRINDDLTKPALIQAERLDWTPSPAPGVERRMLYRVGGEIARATSLVRYAPGSAFPRHVHSGGEEILVLEGTFQDEHGDYPAGCYFRNPPGTSHVPASREGCVIFVRLWQFRHGDDAQIVRQPGEGEEAPPREGAVSARVLFDDGVERVSIERWRAGADIAASNAHGLEALILSGEIAARGERLGPQSWLRLPAGEPLRATCGPDGAAIWIKQAPLEHPDMLAMPA